MKSAIILLTILYLTVISEAAPASATDNECSDLRRVMTINVNKMLIILDPDFLGFTSRENFSDKYCKPFVSWIKSGKDYRNCMKGFGKTLYLMILKKVQKLHKMLCSSSEDKMIEYFDHLKCVNNETLGDINVVVDKMVAFFEGSANQTSQDKLIPSICCGALDLLDVGNRMVNETCMPVTKNPQTANFLVGIIWNIFSDILDLLCGSYSSMDKCIQLQPDVTKEIRDVIANPQKSQAPLLDHFLTIVSKLDESSL